MIYQTKVKLYAPCSQCVKGSFSIDHLKIGQTVTWFCAKCGAELNLMRVSETDVNIDATGRKKMPITVILRSQTVPPIEVKLNTWKYPFLYEDNEDFIDHQKYFYEEHTCPTNWTSEIVEITFDGDNDPHGLFEFISAIDGHYEDPN